MIRLIGILLAVLIAGGIAHAKIPGGSGTTYYVGIPGCSDAGAGTSQAAPWCTLTKVSASIFNPGDTILFQGGGAFSGALVFSNSNASGTSSNPITMDVYGGGVATINSTTSACLTVTNTAGMIIRNLTCNGTGTTSGILFTNSLTTNTQLDFVMLVNVTATGYGTDGFEFRGTSGFSGFKNVSLINCNASGNTKTYTGANGSAGIQFQSIPGYSFGGSIPTFSNIYISGTQANSNTGIASASNWTGSGIFLGEVAGAVIQNSVAHNNGNLSNTASGPVGIWAVDSTSVIIQKNESYSNCTATGTADGGGFDFDGGMSNSIMQYNYSHDNCGAGYLNYTYNDGAVVGSYANTIRYNVSQNDGVFPLTNTQGCIQISTDGLYQNAQVYGNTCYQSQGAGFQTLNIRLGSGILTGTISNNVFYSTNNSTLLHTAGTNPSGMSLIGNDYFASGTVSINWNSVAYSTVALWRAGVPAQETYQGANTSLISNPALTNPGGGSIAWPNAPSTITAYVLQAGSPMLNAGQNMLKQFGIFPGTRDFNGSIVPAPSNGNYDIGSDQRTQ